MQEKCSQASGVSDRVFQTITVLISFYLAIWFMPLFSMSFLGTGSVSSAQVGQFLGIGTLFLLVYLFLIGLKQVGLNLAKRVVSAFQQNVEYALLVGSVDEIKQFLSRKTDVPFSLWHPIGVIVTDAPDGVQITQIDALPVLGAVGDLETVLNHHVVDHVFFASNIRRLSVIEPMMHHCIERGINVVLNAELDYELSNVRICARPNELEILLGVSELHRSVAFSFSKDMLDRILAFCAIVVSLPIFIGCALFIKLDSRGPILFHQERVGRNGRRFKLYKFRTMVCDAEAQLDTLRDQNEMSGPVFKIANDPRVTRVGKWLRKLSLDEFPQFFNVLKGDMSMVGPRPPLPKEVQQYECWQRRRLSVKPGITCTWQVSGRNNIDFDQWVRMDLDYIDQWSFWTDIKLIAATVPAVLTRRGAS